MRWKFPIIAVVGSGTERHESLAVPLGRALAAEGVHLITGGGGGVMSAVAEAFASAPGRRGLVVGILPGGVDDGVHHPRPGYPNPWVEVAIHTHLPLSGITGTSAMSRNHLIILSAAAVIALPGAAGTLSEITLARQYNRPLLAFAPGPDAFSNDPGPLEFTTDLWQLRAFLRRAIR